MLCLYEAKKVRPLVREFYETAWKSTNTTRLIFERIGLKLTEFTLNEILLSRNVRAGKKLFAGPIARAGCGLFRPSVMNLLKNRCNTWGIPVQSFGMGLSRDQNPAKLSAEVYWNTLRYLPRSEFSSAWILLYEMGAATGSTIEGAIKELQLLNISPRKIIFLVGAISIDQIAERLTSVAPGLTLVIGSRWKFDETTGSSQFYLTTMFDGEWIKLSARDWGDCVANMNDRTSVEAFLRWMRLTVDIRQKDGEMLVQRWMRKIANEEQ